MRALRTPWRVPALALLFATASVVPAHAQVASPPTVQALRAELDALKAEQAQRDRRIQRLEEALERLAGDAPADTAPAVATKASAAAPPAEPPAARRTADAIAAAPRLKVAGDLRLRGQGDWSDRDARNRTSMQLRGRLGATFAVNERITIGARLATGDSNDPNSTDVQLSDWLDDLEVSLDMAYAQFNFGELTLYGGKMPQPFARTDLVWDGDVNPQGLGATWRRPLPGGGSLRANALAFIVDEQAAGPDSTMLGAQIGYASPVHGNWSFDVHAAWYQYELGSIAGADAGDFRSNLRRADGSYLSDYRLGNALASVTWNGLGDRWPLRIVADYVHNFGARTDGDTGIAADLTVGRAANRGDWRFTYGHAIAEVDAVLAAFSHDNIGIATNYRLHALTLDYVPTRNTLLSAYWYHYRPWDARFAGTNQPHDWLDRLRLAFLINF